jgi:thymidylate synthase ThyX
MDNDNQQKIRTLLDYLIEHNKEHSQEIAEWAEKARALGADQAGEQMLKAAQQMDKANEFLSRALASLG